MAYSHVDKKNRDKLDLNAKRGIFIGYRRTNRQYRILDPRTGRITESSHVTFRENQKDGTIFGGIDKSGLYHLKDPVPNQVFDQEEQVDVLDLCNPDSSINSEINDNGIQDSSGSGADENSQKNQNLNN